MLEENFRVTREVPATSSCHSHALIGSILDIMSLHLPMRQVLCGLLSLVGSHPWGCLFLGAQEPTSLVRRLNLVTTYSGRRRNFSARYYKRSCKAVTIIYLQTLEIFLLE